MDDSSLLQAFIILFMFYVKILVVGHIFFTQKDAINMIVLLN